MESAVVHIIYDKKYIIHLKDYKTPVLIKVADNHYFLTKGTKPEFVEELLGEPIATFFVRRLFALNYRFSYRDIFCYYILYFKNKKLHKLKTWHSTM